MQQATSEGDAPCYQGMVIGFFIKLGYFTAELHTSRVPASQNPENIL